MTKHSQASMPGVTYPACFPSQDAFNAWRKAALRCNEPSSPCQDCSDGYQSSMLDRCEPALVSIMFVFGAKKARAAT